MEKENKKVSDSAGGAGALASMEHQRELTAKLNEAARAYYQESREVMSNLEYDKLYDELLQLEAESGIVLSGSPTAQVGYEILSELPKEKHPEKMLSLDKTKEVEQLKSWLGAQTGMLSWKLDGLTIVLTYEGGKLVKAVTRGNGEVGEVVTSNARTFDNIPLNIGFKDRLVLRGEAVISYDDFEKINAEISEESAKYKNPRNLCAGSVRQLSSKITAQRHVKFFAFSLVSAEGEELERRSEQLNWLETQGFQVVERVLVQSSMADGSVTAAAGSGAAGSEAAGSGVAGSEAAEIRNFTEHSSVSPKVVDLAAAVEGFAEKVETYSIPSDGLVLCFDDIAYGRSLGTTSKFPRDSIAFKWRDEQRETILKEIEWSASRTGLINPVAIFEPVELEGTTVSRASVHNLSVMKQLGLGIGDTITVYKANMIIPQIADNLTRSENVEIPKCCPVCGGDTIIKNDNGVETLVCPNPECPAKQLKSFTHFVSRDAMNIDGLSEATLEKLIAKGLITELADIFKVGDFHDEIVVMEGFGEKSFEKLKKSVDDARKSSPDRFLYSLGVPNIGVANARLIAKHCKNSWSDMAALAESELTEIEGIGDIMASAYAKFFADEAKQKIVADLLEQVRLDESFEASGTALEGLTFVITGSLNNYENRDALKAEIERAGGKVAGSVSAKTSYLINNDVTSTSGKNKKAKELGVKIIDEETMQRWLGGEPV